MSTTVEIPFLEYQKLQDAAELSEARRKELEFIIIKVKDLQKTLGIDFSKTKESDLLTLVPKLLGKKNTIVNAFDFLNAEYIQNLENLTKNE